nr:hypothetical protein [Tanacetum cinerariifolium]
MSAEKGSLNVAHVSSSNTVIIDKMDRLERQTLDGKLMFVDDDGNCLFLRDDDYDPYYEDLSESHDMSHHLQAICDNVDIRVRGRKKK